MSSHVRRGVYVSKRDLALFDYLFLNKIALARQINRDIFGISDSDSVVRRLRTLVRFGFLRRTTVDDSMPSYAYYLADATFQKYISERVQRSWNQLKSEAANHDIALIDIRKRFLSSERVMGYFTENAIESHFDCPPSFPVRSFMEMHSDAGIIFSVRGKTFHMAIEYEDSPKSSERYEQHFTGYYIRNEIQGVIYIVTDQQLRNRLTEIEKKICQSRTPKVFYGQALDVVNPEKKLIFVNNANDVLLVA